MSDFAAIARPYAKAAYEFAMQASQEDDSSLDRWTEFLQHLSHASSDETMQQLMQDPQVTRSQLSTLLQQVTQAEKVAGAENFLHLLIDNDRLSAASDIAEQFAEHRAKAESSITAEVISAKKLSAEQKERLATALQKRLGLEVSLNEQVDTDLLGGAVVKAGDLVIDGSAKGRIEKLSTALMR